MKKTKNKMKIFLIVFGLLFVIWIAFGYFSSKVERLGYEVLETEGDFELRAVPAHILAETTVSAANYDEASDESFMVVADYIFGNNLSNESVAMTSPVIQEGEEIAMTVPVIQEGEGIAMTAPVVQEASDGEYSMAFVMPAEYSMETLPQPVNDAVELREVAAKELAVLKFSWFVSPEKVAEKQEGLAAWVSEKGWTMKGDFQLARYNPPWTPPFMRLNEVWVEVLR